jgi:hypothetical protein
MVCFYFYHLFRFYVLLYVGSVLFTPTESAQCRLLPESRTFRYCDLNWFLFLALIPTMRQLVDSSFACYCIVQRPAGFYFSLLRYQPLLTQSVCFVRPLLCFHILGGWGHVSPSQNLHHRSSKAPSTGLCTISVTPYDLCKLLR